MLVYQVMFRGARVNEMARYILKKIGEIGKDDPKELQVVNGNGDPALYYLVRGKYFRRREGAHIDLFKLLLDVGFDPSQKSENKAASSALDVIRTRQESDFPAEQCLDLLVEKEKITAEEKEAILTERKVEAEVRKKEKKEKDAKEMRNGTVVLVAVLVALYGVYWGTTTALSMAYHSLF